MAEVTRDAKCEVLKEDPEAVRLRIRDLVAKYLGRDPEELDRMRREVVYGREES